MEVVVTLALLAVVATFAFTKIFQQQQVDQNKVALAEVSAEVYKPIQQGELLGVLHANNFGGYVLKYLNPMQTCQSNPMAQGCAGQASIAGNGKYLSNLLNTLASNGNGGAILASGASVYGLNLTNGGNKFMWMGGFPPPNKGCVILAFDANGPKGPNQISQDMMTCDYAPDQDCTSQAYPWITVKAKSKLCSTDSHPNPQCNGNKLNGSWDSSAYTCKCPGQNTEVDPGLPLGGGCKCTYEAGGQVPNGVGSDCYCPYKFQSLQNGTCTCPQPNLQVADSGSMACVCKAPDQHMDNGGNCQCNNPDQSMPSGQCICPSNKQPINGDTACGCVGGMQWDQTKSICYCPGGQQLVSGTCQCTGGQNWNGSSCYCPGGQSLVSGKCQCPSGQSLQGGQCKPICVSGCGKGPCNQWYFDCSQPAGHQCVNRCDLGCGTNCGGGGGGGTCGGWPANNSGCAGRFHSTGGVSPIYTGSCNCLVPYQLPNLCFKHCRLDTGVCQPNCTG